MKNFRKKIMTLMATAVLGAMSVPSYGWVHGVDVTVTRIVKWEGNGNILIEFSNGMYCYTPPAEKEMYSLVLAAYMAGKSLTVHCYEQTVSTYTYTNTHKLHRVIAN